MNLWQYLWGLCGCWRLGYILRPQVLNSLGIAGCQKINMVYSHNFKETWRWMSFCIFFTTPPDPRLPSLLGPQWAHILLMEKWYCRSQHGSLQAIDMLWAKGGPNEHGCQGLHCQTLLAYSVIIGCSATDQLHSIKVTKVWFWPIQVVNDLLWQFANFHSLLPCRHFHRH